jgi:hypothetical protein
MHFNYAMTTLSLATIAAAMALPTQQLAGRDLDHHNFVFEDFSGADGNKAHKRGENHHSFVFEDFSGELDASGSKVTKRDTSANGIFTDVEKRSKKDYVSSCGSEWVSIPDFQNKNSYWIGYASAVDAFCRHITADHYGNPTVVGPGAYAGTTIRVNDIGDRIGLSKGGDPKDPKTDILPGNIQFEIHNKQATGDHIPDCTCSRSPFCP